MRIVNRKIVSALLISSDNKLIMGMKNPNKGGVYSDCWHIPGGGIDEGEEELVALKREITEEVGIDISSSKTVLVDDKGSGISIKKLKDGEEVECHMQFKVYRVDIPTKSIETPVRLTDDLEKYVWADINKLGDFKLTPPSVELFTRLKWLN